MRRLLAVTADHRLQGVQRVKQKMWVNLSMQELDLRLGEQRLLPLVLTGKDLGRQQLGYPLPQSTVDGAEQAVFRFIQFDGAHHPLIFAAQRDHQR